jgi:type I restriction enzyme, S subunit
MVVDWKISTLGAEVDLISGFPFRSNEYTDDPRDVRLLRGDNIVQGNIRWANAKRWSLEDAPNFKPYELKKDDVVLAMDRPWIDAGLKYAAIDDEDLPCLLLQRTSRLRGGPNLDIRFLRYVIGSPEFTKHIQSITTGSLVPHISSRQIKDFAFKLPPLATQKRIAGVLSTLDAKIALNHRINGELEGLAKLLYDYWFVQYDFPLSATQAAALGKPKLAGQPYRTSGGKMLFHPTLKREIPEGWEVDNILAVADLGGGATPSKKNAEFWKGTIPFFTPTDARNEPFCLDTEDHITQEGLSNSSTRLYDEGTLFITARGSVGKAMIISKEMAMNQSCYALIPREGVGCAFLYFHTLSLMGFLHAKSSGSVFKSIVTNDIKFTPAIVPKSEILKKFSTFTEPLFGQILNNQRQNQELTALRDWLLPMLMNGQVRVG